MRKLRHVPAATHRRTAVDLSPLAIAFAETITHPLDREMVGPTVMLYWTYAGGSFANLDVDAFLACLDGADDAEQIEENAVMLRLGSALYAWLGRTQRVTPARASKIGKQLAAASLARGAMRPLIFNG